MLWHVQIGRPLIHMRRRNPTPNDISRRRVIGLAGAGLAAACGLAPSSAAAQKALRRSRFAGFDTRHLTVRQVDRTEELQAVFRTKNGKPYKPGLDALSWLFRDWRDGDIGTAMDIRLFDRLARIQTMLATVEDRPVVLTLYSGFRTPRRNRSIEGAAAHSQHMFGRAADIAAEGASHDLIADMAEVAGAHGIGRYPIFTHVDVGPPGRRWRG